MSDTLDRLETLTTDPEARALIKMAREEHEKIAEELELSSRQIDRQKETDKKKADLERIDKQLESCYTSSQFTQVFKSAMKLIDASVDAVALLRSIGDKVSSREVHLLASIGVFERYNGSIFDADDSLAGFALRAETSQFTPDARFRSKVLDGISPLASEGAYVIGKPGDIQGVIYVRKEGVESLTEEQHKRISAFVKEREDRFTKEFIIYNSQYDGLAQTLFNRKSGFELIERVFREAERDKDPVAITFFDLDDFRFLNDLLGHVDADEVLYQLGKIYGENSGRDSITLRYGGDEFLRMDKGIGKDKSYEQARQVLQRVENLRIANHVETEVDSDFHVTVTAGVAYHDPRHPLAEGKVTLDRMIRCADDMIRRKEQGKNRVYFNNGDLKGVRE